MQAEDGLIEAGDAGGRAAQLAEEPPGLEGGDNLLDEGPDLRVRPIHGLLTDGKSLPPPPVGNLDCASSGYADAGRLAAHAGLAPVSRDSGRRTGNHHRPKRYHRRLRHVFYMAAQTATMRPGPSRDYYLKKRVEGLIHVQALLALARRRVDVLWAMLRDKRHFTPTPPAPRSA